MKNIKKNKKGLAIIIVLALLLLCVFIGSMEKENMSLNENDSSKIGLTVQDELDEEMEEENTITAPSDWGDENSEETLNNEGNNTLSGQTTDKIKEEISEMNRTEEESDLDEDENNAGGYGDLF